MFPCAPCRICNEVSHMASKCHELWKNKPSNQGGGGEDDHLRSIDTKSGKCAAQEVSHTNGSRAGQWNPLSVISI